MSRLTVEESFRYGFLRGCAEAGLDADEADALVKRAFLGDVGGAARSALVTGLTLPLAASVGLGAAGGYGLAKMTETDPDPEELRNQDLIDTYDALARDARLRQELRRRRALVT